jgi:dihydrofolate synthase / folylpolyglutamate synthase
VEKRMTYKETLDFLYSQLPAYHRIGKAAYKNDLGNTLALDAYFGHPHKRYKTIHIAGTNGKGSVSHLTSSVLQESGFRTGLYTSPHLKDFRERIKVNGEMIPENEVISFVELHKDILKSVQPSFFEMSVAMALDYFARVNVDIAVIEVGLGGRLDSTNIITPLISVITNIGHDHMDLLGDSLSKIAIEKAGVIKKGIPVVIGETTAEIRGIFSSYAEKSSSQIYFSEENYSCSLEKMNLRQNERHFIVTSNTDRQRIEGTIPLGGDYQEANLRTLIQLLKCLEGTLNLTAENIVGGIRNVVKNTGLMGRWQILGSDPLIVCDTGHNREGLEYVIKQLLMISVIKRHFVIGFVSDKDLGSVLPLFPDDAEYYFTRASVPRAMDENKLMKEASLFGLKGKSYSSVEEAYTAARLNANQADLIFVGGSTFVVAEVI